MKYNAVAIFLVIFAVLANHNAQAGNPGVNALDCLDVGTTTWDVDNLEFTNKCGYNIFVVWCGDLKPNQSQMKTSQCGDGLNNTYYTRATNLDANAGTLTTIKTGGTYGYAACQGRIAVEKSGGGVTYLPNYPRTNGLNIARSFEIKGMAHPSQDGGRFSCTPTNW